MRRVARLAAALLLTCAAACGGSSPASPTPPSASTAEAYLNEIIGVMQFNSINRQHIDWTAFRSQVLAQAAGAKTIPETYPAIGLALQLLDDHHSFYVAANGAPTIGNPTFPAGCGVPAVPDPAVPADIGYVRIPGFSGAGSEDFAASIQNAITARDASNVFGWIVDLRGNGGGNMWPMLAGVGPVLGTGIAGYFVPPTGSPSAWGYRDGASFLSGNAVTRVAVPHELLRADPRVAVLTDKRVTSSGEAIAIAFRGRPKTRTFGTETCGLPTANSEFTLSDGGRLTLTTALDGDRTITTYDGPLQPDERIDDPSAVVQRAMQWLRSGG